MQAVFDEGLGPDRVVGVPEPAAHSRTVPTPTPRQPSTPAGVSVADAHVGGVMQTAPDAQITVITSDLDDMRQLQSGLAACRALAPVATYFNAA